LKTNMTQSEITKLHKSIAPTNMMVVMYI
jgi:hypothetical protein